MALLLLHVSFSPKFNCYCPRPLTKPQPASLCNLFPPRHLSDRPRQPGVLLQWPYLSYGLVYNRHMPPPCLGDSHPLHRLCPPATIRPSRLGELPRNPRCHPRIYSVLPTNLYDLPASLRWEPKYPNDVHSDSGKFDLGRKSSGT